MSEIVASQAKALSVEKEANRQKLKIGETEAELGFVKKALQDVPGSQTLAGDTE